MPTCTLVATLTRYHPAEDVGCTGNVADHDVAKHMAEIKSVLHPMVAELAQACERDGVVVVARFEAELKAQHEQGAFDKYAGRVLTLLPPNMSTLARRPPLQFTRLRAISGTAFGTPA